MSTLFEREICVQDLDDESPLTKEITLGLSYRALKSTNQTLPIKPKHSPISAPFRLCRALQKSHRRKKKNFCKCAMMSSHHSNYTNMTLLDRSVLTQEKYMDMLSIPQRYSYIKRKKPRKRATPKICCKCKIEPCSPRLIQMAIPNKRYVLENWKTYQDRLPAEILARFDQILKSGNNLEPREARYYFKQLKMKKNKEIRRRKRRCKRRKEIKKRGDLMWLKCQIDQTTCAMVTYIMTEPLLTLNFNQMMTSDELLKYLASQKVFCIKNRSTKNVYKKTVIEISDKLVKWMDTMSFFADIQPLDSKEKIIEIPSLESLLEQEEEEEEEEIEEELGEEERLRGTEGEGEMESEGSEAGEDFEQFLAQKIVDRITGFGEGDEGSFMDMLKGLDEDILEKLIQILSESPEDFLKEGIDTVNMPGVAYSDILEKLKEIRDGNLLEVRRERLQLEEKMIEWAKINDPDRVDDKILDKIHETSTILNEWFKNVGLSSFQDRGRGADGFGRSDDEWGAGEEDMDEMKPFEELYGRGEGKGGDILAGATTDEEAGDEFKEAQQDMGGADFGQGPLEGGEGYGDIDELEREFIEEGAIREGFAPGEGEGEEGLGAPGSGGFKAGDEGLEGLGAGEGFGAGEGLDEDALAAEMKALEEGLLGEEFGEGVEGLEEGEGFGLGAGEGESEAEGELEERLSAELERLSGRLGIIRGHKPSVVYEHTPGTICCLSLKIWAVWLLEIATNAHNWTKWIADIIKQVRYYCSVIRGDVVLPNGEKKVLYKEEWRKFVADTEEKVIAWRHYSKHVKDLSNEIIENFRGKPVTCCPKCLQDHLIKNVVTAHETLQALTEAINCAEYWQRCLDRIVEQTSKLTDIEVKDDAADVKSLSSEESYTIEIEELSRMPTVVPVASEVSYGSVYEIEELSIPPDRGSDYELIEIGSGGGKGRVTIHEIVEISESVPCPPESSKIKLHQKGKEAPKAKKPKKK